MHPSASAQTENKLAARHVSFAFEPNLAVEEIRDVEGNQVRLSEHRAPKSTVDRYAEQMKAGATSRRSSSMTGTRSSTGTVAGWPPHVTKKIRLQRTYARVSLLWKPGRSRSNLTSRTVSR